MEEDIEILEQILSELDENGVVVLNFANGEAIKNLLTRYKQLEEKNEELRADNYELNNRITDLLENIPVQKVKEKIEELEEEPNKMVIDKKIPEEYKNLFLDERAILALQELLGEE